MDITPEKAAPSVKNLDASSTTESSTMIEIDVTNEGARLSVSFRASSTPEKSISILRDKDLLKIFTYLSCRNIMRARRVCVKWRQIANETLASRKKLQFSGYRKLTVKSVIDIVCSCGPNLEELIMPDYYYRRKVCDKEVETIARSCPNLVKINLSGSRMEDDGLNSLAINCTKLQDIDLSYCSDMTDIGVEFLLESLPNLKSLSIELTYRLFGTCLKKMKPQMEKLRLCETTIIRPFDIFDVLLNHCQHIKDLSLTGRFPLWKDKFRLFCQNSVSIKNLHISSMTFDYDMFVEIAHMTWLEGLSITGCAKLGEDAIFAISKGCRNLKFISLSRSFELRRDSGLLFLAENCIQLVDLDISGIIFLDRRPFEQLAKVGNLKRLVAYATGILSTDIIQLVTLCHRLEFMDLRKSECLDDSMVRPCFEAMALRNNDVKLTLWVDGTSITRSAITDQHPLLSFVFQCYNDHVMEHYQPKASHVNEYHRTDADSESDYSFDSESDYSVDSETDDKFI